MPKPGYKPSATTHFISYEEAVVQIPKLERQLRRQPEDWRSMVNLGNARFTVGDTEDALGLLLRALDIVPNHAVANCNIGIVLAELTRFAEAFPYIEKANRLDPTDRYAASAYAEFLLRAGQWRMGWDLYERARFSIPECPLPKWTGEQPIEGRRLLVIQEGGAGDVFMALRFFHNLKLLDAHVSFACDKALHCVLDHPWIDQLLTFGDKIDLSDFDYYVSSFSLTPIIAQTLDDVMAQWPGPYMKPERAIRRLVGAKPKVGLCWRAGEHDENKRHRCLSDSNIKTLMEDSGYQWVNLQYGETLEGAENPDISTWEHTADVIDGLNLVISVDTGVMHLAGAIGKPVWTLLSNSCWRFMLSGEECVWYPTMRLFRNKRKGYDDAVGKVVESLAQSLHPRLARGVM